MKKYTKCIFLLSIVIVLYTGGPGLNSGKKNPPGDTMIAGTYKNTITIFLTGDVMTGRGIDQSFTRHCDYRLHEPYVKDARLYIKLAEEANGPMPRPLEHAYIWGDALTELKNVSPDVRIINLETSITTSTSFWPGKSVHYKMHPQNVSCLKAASIDCCVLSNNHVLDWGRTGLLETLNALRKANIDYIGAGKNREEAVRCILYPLRGKGRIILLAYGHYSSGIPRDWNATEDRPGINMAQSLNADMVKKIKQQVDAVRRQHDIVLFSIHWGNNWGYEIPARQRDFAHALIDEAGVDLVHGHSSHHVKGIEVYKGRLILYGAGDFLNDYEGIGGEEGFRGDLTLMYFASIDPKTGALVQLRMVPMRINNFRLTYALPSEVRWLQEMLNREGRVFGTSFTVKGDRGLFLNSDY